MGSWKNSNDPSIRIKRVLKFDMADIYSRQIIWRPCFRFGDKKQQDKKCIRTSKMENAKKWHPEVANIKFRCTKLKAPNLEEKVPNFPYTKISEFKVHVHDPLRTYPCDFLVYNSVLKTTLSEKISKINLKWKCLCEEW